MSGYCAKFSKFLNVMHEASVMLVFRFRPYLLSGNWQNPSGRVYLRVYFFSTSKFTSSPLVIIEYWLDLLPMLLPILAFPLDLPCSLCDVALDSWLEMLLKLFRCTPYWFDSDRLSFERPLLEFPLREDDFPGPKPYVVDFCFCGQFLNVTVFRSASTSFCNFHNFGRAVISTKLVLIGFVCFCIRLLIHQNVQFPCSPLLAVCVLCSLMSVIHMLRLVFQRLAQTMSKGVTVVCVFQSVM